MFEIARHFEQIAVRFSPIFLIGPGLICVLVGLFVWLGGLGFRRFLAAVVGAISGCFCGIFIIGQNIISSAALAAMACFIAVMFEKIFITVLAAAIAAVLGFVILARPYVENPSATISAQMVPMQSKTQQKLEPFSIHQTTETVKAYIADFKTEIKQLCSQMPAYNWVIIIALAAVFIASGFFLPRLTSVLCCAAVGAMLVFAGMILLLLYKGAAPISGIWRRSLFYAAVFIAMTAFGAIEQLLLCQRVKEKSIRKKQPKDKDADKEQHPDWRTI